MDSKIKFTTESTMALESLVNGFNQGCKVIMGRKKEYINLIKTAMLENSIAFRKGIRDTRVYAEFLLAIRNPEVMHENKELSILSMLNRREHKSISNYEIEALRAGSIPSFYFHSSNKDLLNDKDQVVVKDYFEKNPIEIIEDKVNALTNKMISYQSNIIRMSYKMTHPEYKSELDIYGILKFTEGMLFKEGKEKYNYYGLCLDKNGEVNLQEGGNGIYNASGWAIAFAIIGFNNNDKKYKKVAVKILNAQKKTTDMTLKNGLLGTAVAYYTLQCLGISCSMPWTINTSVLSEAEMGIYQQISTRKSLESVLNAVFKLLPISKKVGLIDFGIDGRNKYLNEHFESVHSIGSVSKHGMEVAGTGTIAMMANPCTSLYSYGISDSNSTTVINCMEQALIDGVDIMNISLNTVVDIESKKGGRIINMWDQILNEANKKRTLIVVSAGNNGINLDELESTVLFPAMSDKVLTIGAIDRTGEVTRYSNTGGYVNDYAPGGVLSLLPKRGGRFLTLGGGEDGSSVINNTAKKYIKAYGTSIAAGVYTGFLTNGRK